MFDLFEMDVDQPMYTSLPTNDSQSLYSIQAATRQRNLRHPKSMPILRQSMAAELYTLPHESLGSTSLTNEEDHAMESDARTYRKRLRKTKNDLFTQSKDSYESDMEDHPQFRMRERHDAFAAPFEGVVALPWCESFDTGSPSSATPPMSEDETQQRRKRVRVPSEADQTNAIIVSGMTERRPIKKLRGSLP